MSEPKFKIGDEVQFQRAKDALYQDMVTGIIEQPGGYYDYSLKNYIGLRCEEGLTLVCRAENREDRKAKP